MPFIVIEGLDGSGKSTQIQLIRDYFSRENISYQYLHFPRTAVEPFGGLVAAFLRGDFGNIGEVHPRLVSLLYAMDRFDAKQVLEDWLDQNTLVLADRYVYSNIAFQCAKIDDPVLRQELSDWIWQLEFEYFKIPKPHLSLYLDVPFSFITNNLTRQRKGADRDYLAGKNDIHEDDLGFQQKVHDVYRWQVRSRKDFIPVNCSLSGNKVKSPGEIFSEILSLFRSNQVI